MEPILIGIIAVVALLALIFLGVHIAIALGVVAFVGLVLITNLNSALSLTARSFYTAGGGQAVYCERRCNEKGERGRSCPRRR